MAIKWTDEQLLAIKTADRGVVVPAAAGSGKTAVLIERTVRMLADPDPVGGCPAEKLLAVTFTKDAAEQMKRKLRTALGKKISSLGRSDPQLCRWLETQQEMLELATISTINSFCLELVKGELSEFDYRSGIRIADETDAAAITAEAMKITLEQLRAETPEQVELLVDALTNDSDKMLAEKIEEFRTFTRSLAFPKKWVERTKQSLSDPKFADECAAAIISEKLLPLLEKAMKLRESAEYAAAKLPDSQKYLDLCGDDLEILEDIFTALRSGEWRRVYDSVQSVKFPTLRKPSDKGMTQEEAISQQQIFDGLKSSREQMKAAVDKLKKSVNAVGADIYEPMLNSAYIFSALAAAAERQEKNSMEIKLERGLAEFGDVERMAMRLLVTEEDGKAVRTPFAEQLRAEGRYKVLLIDEFQDVNNLQEMIFAALSDTDDLDVLGKNVFVVGDIKQSIYRFRQSNPNLFIEAVEKAGDPRLPDLCEIRLTQNFRSRRTVIDFANALFTTVMSKELGGVSYSAERGEALVFGAANRGGGDPPCELMLIGADEDDEWEINDFGEEELAVANKIKSMYESGFTVYDDDKPRRARLSDFCVLARGHKTCRRVAAALHCAGLKAESEQTDGYMGAREIMIMVDLLKVIDDPLRDMSLAAVMLSPIMGFTVEELAKIKLRADRDSDEPMRLHLVLTRAAKDETADERESSFIDLHDEVLQDKCRAAAQLLKRLDFYSVSLPISSLINKIYDETGFFAAASAYENPKQRRANLRMFTQYAAAYEKNNSGGIAGFLRYLERVSESKDFKQAVVTAAGEDAVAVKTFHSSKGLEYPVVILCGLNTAFSASDIKKNVLLHEYAGAGIRYMRHDCLMNADTVARLCLIDKVRREQLSEEMRLLYVAVTRAKDKLIVPIYLKKSANSRFDISVKLTSLADEIAAAGGANSRILGECGCFAEWIAAFVMQSDLNQPLLEAIGREDLAAQLAGHAKYSPDQRPYVEWCDADISLPDSVNEEEIGHAADSAKVTELRKKYALEYVGGGEDTAASKRTVTEIVAEMRREENSDEATDHSFFPQLGSLEEQAGRLTAAQRGTYTHLFMELADYDRAERGVRAELDRLISSGRMSETEGKGVYVNALERFFAGSFYRRMKRSDEIKRELKFMVSADDAGLDEKFLRFIDRDGMLQGVCDCIFREPDGYVLVDYKTDGFTDVSQLDSYHVQLELYKAALDIILPLPVKACYIYSFKLARGKEITL